ncbi:MAG: ATP-binding cassette domain-containing protein [Bacteroidia bacterium]
MPAIADSDLHITLRCEALGFAYSPAATFRFPDFETRRGEPFLILGESGRGKTTLLHLLAGLLRPQSGHVYVAGQDLGRFSNRQLDRFRGRHIGLVFQRAHFIDALSVAENLALAQSLAGLKPDPARIHDLLGRLSVQHKAQALPRRLSMGEQQRVAIARALVNRPGVVLADEPTSSLDDRNTAQVIDLLEEQSAQDQATLVIVTHDKRLKSRFAQSLTL